jgi:hypothetical protein
MSGKNNWTAKTAKALWDVLEEYFYEELPDLIQLWQEAHPT